MRRLKPVPGTNLKTKAPLVPGTVNLAVEFITLFVAVPVGIAFLRWHTSVHTTPLVAVFLLLAGYLLWRDRGFDRQNLWRWDAVRSGWKGIVARFIPLAMALGLIFWILKPAPPLQYAREHTAAWLIFAIFAPI